MTVAATGFQVMPALSDEEYRALEESIREHGVQVPVSVAADGRIVDGHHRDEIARRLDRHCPRVTVEGADTELRTLAFELNNHRRQQGREARRGQVRKSLRADPQLSNREHARRTGVHHETVQSIRTDMEACGEIRHTETRTDSTGREQVASKPERAPSAGSPAEPEVDLGRVDKTTGEIHDPVVTFEQQVTAAVEEFPDLAYYVEAGRSDDVVLMAGDLRRYRERGELEKRLSILRRSIEVDRSKRDGTFRPAAPVAAPAKHCATCTCNQE